MFKYFKKLWIGSSDGEHYVISDDPGEMPADCTPAPVVGKDIGRHVERMERYGKQVREIYLNNDE